MVKRRKLLEAGAAALALTSLGSPDMRGTEHTEPAKEQVVESPAFQALYLFEEELDATAVDGSISYTPEIRAEEQKFQQAALEEFLMQNPKLRDRLHTVFPTQKITAGGASVFYVIGGDGIRSSYFGVYVGTNPEKYLFDVLAIFKNGRLRSAEVSNATALDWQLFEPVDN